MVKRSIKISISVVGLLLLVGCSSTPEVREVLVPYEVKVPVVVEPDPPPSRDLPELPISSISNDDSDKDVVIKYDRTIQVLMTEVLWYRKILYGDKNDDIE